MTKSTVYSGGFVSIKRQELLNEERAERLIKAVSLLDAQSVLLECGYDKALLKNNQLDIDLLLKNELGNAVEFFEEYCADKKLKEACLKKLDYHNAKILLKEKYAETVSENAFYPSGLLDTKVISEAIALGEYEALPKPMAQALSDLDLNLENGTFDLREIDITLDKAMFRDIANCVKGIKNKNIREYFVSNADITNIMICARCRSLGFKPVRAVGQFVFGGIIPTDSLRVLLDGTLRDISIEFSGSEYSEIIEEIFRSIEQKSGFSDMEIALMEALFLKSRTGILNLFTDEPLFAWYIQKLNELKAVRLIMTFKKNNVDEAVIMDKVRSAFIYG